MKYNWFSHRPKRNKIFREIYKKLESATPKKIPGMAGTRWLAPLEAMNVIVKQWDALEVHFQ